MKLRINTICYVILASLLLAACGAPDMLEEQAEMLGYAGKEQGSVLVTTTTRFKKTMTDVSANQKDPNKFCEVDEETKLVAEVFYGNESDGEHVKVKVTSAPTGCNFTVGYFYRDHVNIQKNVVDSAGNDSGNDDSGSGEGSINRKLLKYYDQQVNYNKVSHNVFKGWFRQKENSCVAFASSALRLSQAADIPFSSGISVNTIQFSNYLRNQLGWKKITSLNNIKSGDVAFSQGSPDHTYVFASWENKANLRAYVIDNQGYRYVRNMGRGGYTPFAYALRSPN